LATPGWFAMWESIASARRIANGVKIWPNGSVKERRHCASAVSLV
jgi:hypothetical protein